MISNLDGATGGRIMVSGKSVCRIMSTAQLALTTGLSVQEQYLAAIIQPMQIAVL